MFTGCLKLTTIKANSSTWVTTQADTTDMFLNCGTNQVTFI